MTVNEFSAKYNVPRTLVYEASFRLKGANRYDFEPADLAGALRELVERRRAYHRKHVARAEQVLKNIERVREEEHGTQRSGDTADVRSESGRRDG